MNLLVKGNICWIIRQKPDWAGQSGKVPETGLYWWNTWPGLMGKCPRYCHTHTTCIRTVSNNSHDGQDLALCRILMAERGLMPGGALLNAGNWGQSPNIKKGIKNYLYPDSMFQGSFWCAAKSLFLRNWRLVTGISCAMGYMTVPFSCLSLKRKICHWFMFVGDVSPVYPVLWVMGLLLSFAWFINWHSLATCYCCYSFGFSVFSGNWRPLARLCWLLRIST